MNFRASVLRRMRAFASSICAPISPGAAAKSPEPPYEQKVQPP